MTNEQLLQIGRMVGETVREAVQDSEARMTERMKVNVQESEERMKVYMRESEERMKGYVQGVVEASEERLTRQIKEVVERLSEVDERLSSQVEHLNELIQHSMDDTEKMAQQIAATAERMERIEMGSVRADM